MWVWDCAFSGDSAYLVTGMSPQRVGRTGARLSALSCSYSLASSTNSPLWFPPVSSDKKGCLWDLTQDTEEPALELKAHQRAITAVALHDI